MGGLVKQQQQIQQYYDATTQWFMRFGSTRTHGSIHRALYVDDIRVDDPTQTIHHLIKATITQYIPGAHTLLDVGCGVGASLHAIRQLTPQIHDLHGVTLSNVQARYAQQSSLHNVLLASYHALPYPSQSMDVVIAIESMIHSDQPHMFWQEISRVLRPGGILIVCDDMLGDGDQLYRDLFQRGWHAPNLESIATHQEWAKRCGFEMKHTKDLTPHLRLVPVPSQVMPWLEQSYEYLISMPLLTSTIGSIALQYLLNKRAIAYTYLVFERQ